MGAASAAEVSGLKPIRQSLASVAAGTFAVLVVLLGGCGNFGTTQNDSPSAIPSGGTYVVKSGDTLFGIASRYGLDYRDLALWNQLGDGSFIYPGQRLRLRAPEDTGTATLPSRSPGSAPDLDQPLVRWNWPTAGVVVLGFGESPKTASGILIGGYAGQPVVAAGAGEVVYSGTGLAGYGQLLIIKHNATWLSAYGHNAGVLVEEGNRVTPGQQIARMGEGPGQRPSLHFEIRRNGQPVNPLAYLPTQH